MPARGRNVFVVEAPGVGKLARDFDKAERKIQDRINRTMRMVDAIALHTFQEEAPEDTGQLKAGLRSAIFFRGKVVRVSVRSTGARRGRFNYLDVTRYGHAVDVIRPRHGRALKVHVAGRKAMPVLRRNVRGYRPPVDWVEQAQRRTGRHVRRAARVLARDIDTIRV